MAGGSGHSHHPESKCESKSESKCEAKCAAPPARRTPRPPTETQRKVTAIVFDILFGTMILYMVYLYCGFRYPYMQSHQWFGMDDTEGVGRIAHTLFAMILAVVSREISQPAAQMMQVAFSHFTTRVPWQHTNCPPGSEQ